MQNSELRREDPKNSDPAPRVFDFSDYRKFLSVWFQWKRQNQSGYSATLFARRAGLQSHTLLGLVIRGQRNLSASSIRAFSKALALKGKEATYFEKLVLFNQAESAEDKAYYFAQLLSQSQGRSRELLTELKNHAECIRHWHRVAILQLVSLRDFQPDPSWMVQKLKRRLSRKDAEESWTALEKLGLVALDSSGRWKIVHQSIDLDPNVLDFAVRKYHQEFLDLAKYAIDHQGLDERELSSLTLSVSHADLPLLRERIKEFRKQLIADFPSVPEGQRDQVVAINTQLLVLTSSEEREKKEP